MSLKENIEEYYDKGFTIVKDIIPPDWVEIVGAELLRLETWKNDQGIKDNDPKDFGTGHWWKGFDMATHISPLLKKYYHSELLYNLATSFLKTEEIYFYNDEIVTKYPKEPCKFMLHTDNEYGPDPVMAVNGDYRLVNFYWILDDHTPLNGPIRFQDIKEPRPTEENIWLDHGQNPPGKGWEWTYPKRGDMVVFDGNCLHYSVSNISDDIRRAWANQYTTIPVGNIPFNNKKHNIETWKGFYSDRFTI